MTITCRCGKTWTYPTPSDEDAAKAQALLQKEGCPTCYNLKETD